MKIKLFYVLAVVMGLVGCVKKIEITIPQETIIKEIKSVVKIEKPEPVKIVKVEPSKVEVDIPDDENIYVVRPWRIYGDCLWNIALWEYNDAFQWKRIYEANKNIIDDPDLIFIGQELIIP